jgi:hypothetical protein
MWDRAHDRRLSPSERTSGRPVLVRHLVVQAPPRCGETCPAESTRPGGQRSERRHLAISSMAFLAEAFVAGEIDKLGVDTECATGGGFRRHPAASSVFDYPGWRGPRHISFPCHRRVTRTYLCHGGGQKDSPRAAGGAQRHHQGGGKKCGRPRFGWHQACSPEQGSSDCPAKRSRVRSKM